MSIERISMSDVPVVHELISGSFDPVLRPFMTSAQPGAENFLRAFVRHGANVDDRVMAVSKDENDRVLGYADFRLLGEGASFLSYIAVSEAARGRGVATEMLRWFVGTHSDIRTMELDVFAENAAATRLYAKLGFEEMWRADWSVRDVEPAQGTSAGWVLRNAPNAEAWLEHFGFCEYSVVDRSCERKFGRIGEFVVKATSVKDFDDPGFLGAVADFLKQRVQVLYIGDGARVGESTATHVVNTSVRMRHADVRLMGR